MTNPIITLSSLYHATGQRASHCLPRLLALAVLLLSVVSLSATERFISFEGGDIHLNAGGRTCVAYSSGDCRGVSRAVQSLASDIKSVCGADVTLSPDDGSSATIVIGTIGHSPLIDRMAREGVKPLQMLSGKREQYVITSVAGKIVIAGSDRRGTIYGIYELSRQMGVSPWYYWMDVPTEHHDNVYMRAGVYTDGEPVVRYRGIFLNDEAPCLTSWVKNTFGTEYGGHEFYERVFELILRLKGNMLWPAMWGWAFYADDPENGRLADEMGVVIGTSHHEPMARNHQEWARHRKEYGAWNYNTNRETIKRFFREGIERMKGTDDIVTIGMRGDGDEAMSAEADTKLLMEIVADQRKIIKDVTRRPAKETPQVWALYKEVLDYYDKGMRVPDDVIMLLCDDNWGNVRRVPTAKERKHKGGWGLYYHVDYVGAPRNTKWINVTPIQNMWEQLTLAADYGIESLWILNVGDLKPMEYPITLFLDMAWNPKRYTIDNILGHTHDFCREAFGESQAEEAARILNLLCKYNGRVTAEMMDKDTYNAETGEWQRVVTEYTELERDALNQFVTLPEPMRDAYRQLILFPVQAMGNLCRMYQAQAMNHLLAAAGNPDANCWAEKVRECFKRDSLLCDYYNTQMAGGKWNGMMTQKHIGYTTWNDNFPCDRMPEVKTVTTTGGGNNIFTAKDGVAVMEAPHYYAATPSATAAWTELPYMGRTLGGMALMPYTEPVGGAWIEYRFETAEGDVKADSVDVRIVVKSTLDFLNKGGHVYDVSLDGSAPVSVNFNSMLNEKPENIYSIYYPTIARRVVESVVRLPIKRGAARHSIKILPRDPGIVFEKVIADMGGYRKSYLHMDESPRKQQK